MKFSKIIAMATLGFVVLTTCVNQNSIAGTSYLKENAIEIRYDTEFKGGFEEFGIEVPIGFSVEGGRKAIGTVGVCNLAFSTCDTSKNVFTPF